MKWLGKKFWLALLVIIILVLICYYIGFSKYFSLDSIKSHADYVKNFVVLHYIISVIVFILISMGLIAFTLPVTAPVAVSAGFLFGLLPGIIYSMVATIIGTAISFLTVRYAMSHISRNRYSAQLDTFKKKLHAYGYTYLITLQLLTVVPYFIINTLAALAGIPFTTFLWTTGLGSLPIVIIYAFAGRQLYMIQSWHNILSINMLLLLLVLGFLALLPMIIRKMRGLHNDVVE